MDRSSTAAASHFEHRERRHDGGHQQHRNELEMQPVFVEEIDREKDDVAMFVYFVRLLHILQYEILVRLSERSGRRMRMAQLADSLSHSRSRVTHTVSRMERAGLVNRSSSPRTGAGSWRR